MVNSSDNNTFYTVISVWTLVQAFYLGALLLFGWDVDFSVIFRSYAGFNNSPWFHCYCYFFWVFFDNCILQFDCLYLETKNAVIEPDGGGAHL